VNEVLDPSITMNSRHGVHVDLATIAVLDAGRAIQDANDLPCSSLHFARLLRGFALKGVRVKVVAAVEFLHLQSRKLN